ncbi:hypothetical protein T06_9547 [Trichinella sp. T6]|nr:hypothetical protein T06_9547 [Trichinella sp. T6]
MKTAKRERFLPKTAKIIRFSNKNSKNRKTAKVVRFLPITAKIERF